MGKQPGRPKTTDGKCPKCPDREHARPRLEGHSWCGECLSAYQKSHTQTKLDMARSQAFAKGVEMTVKTLADEFLRYDENMGGEATVTCATVADIIRRAPRPRLPELAKV